MRAPFRGGSRNNAGGGEGNRGNRY
jgi:hypothetical protein